MAVSVQSVAAPASSRAPPLPQSINRLVCTNRKNPKPDLNLGWVKCKTLHCRVWHCPNIACNFENHVIVCSAITRIPKRELILPALGSAIFTQNELVQLPDDSTHFPFCLFRCDVFVHSI